MDFELENNFIRPIAKLSFETQTSHLDENLKTTDSLESQMSEGVVNSRSTIMKEAIRLFALHGLDGTSVRDIAQASNCNISAISYYFGGKTNLYKAVIREFALNSRDEFNKIHLKYKNHPANQTNFFNFVSDMIDIVHKMIYHSNDHFKILEREKIFGHPNSKELVQEVLIPVSNQFIAVFEEAQSLGLISKDTNGSFFFFMMLEAIKGLSIHNECAKRSEFDFINFPDKPQFVKEQLLNLFKNGLAKKY